MISKAQLDHRRYPSEIKLIISSYLRDIDNAVRWIQNTFVSLTLLERYGKNAMSYKDWKKTWFLNFQLGLYIRVFGLLTQIFNSLVSRPVRAIRVSGGGLEPSAIAQAKNREQGGSDREWTLPTGLRGNVTSEIAENNWDARHVCTRFRMG